MRQQRTTPYYHAAIMTHIRGNLTPVLRRVSPKKPEIHVNLRTKEAWEAIFPSRYPVVSKRGICSIIPICFVVVKIFDEQQRQATIDAMVEETNQLASQVASQDTDWPFTRTSPGHGKMVNCFQTQEVSKYTGDCVGVEVV